jgi:hypothetical protein
VNGESVAGSPFCLSRIRELCDFGIKYNKIITFQIFKIMTKNDFILHAMLQMAANPVYVTTKRIVDENDVIHEFPAIEEELIYIDAEALANEAEKRLDKPFDDLGNLTQLQVLVDIQKQLEEIKTDGLLVIKDEE